MGTRTARDSLLSVENPPDLEVDDGEDGDDGGSIMDTPGGSLPEKVVAAGLMEENGSMRSDAHALEDTLDTGALYPSVANPQRTARRYDSETLASTRSLYATDTEYRMIGGRRYSPGYYRPNDEDEQCREQIEHQVFLALFSSLCTIPLENPTGILDIGAGTGDWAIEMGEKYRDCDVVGTDVSAIQPSAVPNNVFFEIFDAEDEDDWTYPLNYFDLVHFRNMMGAFFDWKEIYRRAFTHTKPGGWIEIIDFGPQHQLAARFAEDSEIHQWLSAMLAAARASERGYSYHHLNPDMLTAAGYVDVQSTYHMIPLGLWSEDESMLKVAKLWLVACLEGFESMSLQPLTQVLGWEPEEVRRVCGLIGHEMKALAMDPEKCNGFAVKCQVLIGRKPEAAPLAMSVDAHMNGGGNMGAEGERMEHENEHNHNHDEDDDDDDDYEIGLDLGIDMDESFDDTDTPR